jgi:hypothetical protein
VVARVGKNGPQKEITENVSFLSVVVAREGKNGPQKKN